MGWGAPDDGVPACFGKMRDGNGTESELGTKAVDKVGGSVASAAFGHAALIGLATGGAKTYEA